MTELELAREIVKVLDNKKGMDIKLIEITEHLCSTQYQDFETF